MVDERLKKTFVALALVLAALAALYGQAFDAADRRLADNQVRLLRRHFPQPVARDVVLVGIDEETYRSFSEPFALWHPHLGKFLKAMALAKPAVVGLDIVLPDKSYNFLIPDYDRPLLQGLAALRGIAPIVLAHSLDEHGNQRALFPPYISLAGSEAPGSVAVCRDADLVVRRFDESDCGNATAPTLAGRMARQLGIEQHWSGFIDYAAGDPVSYLPLQKVLRWSDEGNDERLRSTFAGKPVLLGVILPYSDRHPLPVALAAFEPETRLLPGVLVHLQAVRSMMHHGLIQPAPAFVVILLSMAALGFWLGQSGWIKASLLLIGIAVALAGSTLLLWKGWLVPAGTLCFLAAAAFLVRLGYDARGQIRERRFLRNAFGSSVSPQILKEILRGRISPGVAGTRQNLCVVYCRLLDFNPRAHELPPEESIGLLNDCFSAVTAAVYQHGGATNKFLGDALIAFFGAPQLLPNPNKSALEAAQDMLEEIGRLNKRLRDLGKKEIVLTIGIHCGEAVLGYVGGSSHHEYTAVGPAVSIASRLQGLCRELGFPVVCSVKVADSVGRVGGLRDLGVRPLRGHQPLQLFGWQPPAIRQEEATLTPQEVPS